MLAIAQFNKKKQAIQGVSLRLNQGRFEPIGLQCAEYRACRVQKLMRFSRFLKKMFGCVGLKKKITCLIPLPLSCWEMAATGDNVRSATHTPLCHTLGNPGFQRNEPTLAARKLLQDDHSTCIN